MICRHQCCISQLSHFLFFHPFVLRFFDSDEHVWPKSGGAPHLQIICCTFFLSMRTNSARFFFVRFLATRLTFPICRWLKAAAATTTTTSNCQQHKIYCSAMCICATFTFFFNVFVVVDENFVLEQLFFLLLGHALILHIAWCKGFSSMRKGLKQIKQFGKKSSLC